MTSAHVSPTVPASIAPKSRSARPRAASPVGEVPRRTLRSGLTRHWTQPFAGHRCSRLRTGSNSLVLGNMLSVLLRTNEVVEVDERALEPQTGAGVGEV